MPTHVDYLHPRLQALASLTAECTDDVQQLMRVCSEDLAKLEAAAKPGKAKLYCKLVLSFGRSRDPDTFERYLTAFVGEAVTPSIP